MAVIGYKDLGDGTNAVKVDMDSATFDSDGRYCHVHPWSEDELIWLEARTSGITGIQILTELPSNWESKGE